MLKRQRLKIIFYNKRYNVCLIGISHDEGDPSTHFEFQSFRNMNVSRFFSKQDSTISLATNFQKAQMNCRDMVLNPGSEYKILETDICYYISLEKDENIKPADHCNLIKTFIFFFFANSFLF